MMKAFIDRTSEELITIGFMPEVAIRLVEQLNLKGWGWIDSNDRAIPEGWEVIEVLGE